MSKTPETDKEVRRAMDECQADPRLVKASFARTLETQRDEARETLDLMCDEFQRIKALNDLPLEAHTFCDRAMTGIKQRVPLIEQRDKAEKERDEARAEVERLRKALDAGPCDCDGRFICECCHILGKKPPTVATNDTSPEIFEAHWREWYRHTPGDKMPCDGGEWVNALLRDGEIACLKDDVEASFLDWGKIPDCEECEIIGWRPADAPEKLERK